MDQVGWLTEGLLKQSMHRHIHIDKAFNQLCSEVSNKIYGWMDLIISVETHIRYINMNGQCYKQRILVKLSLSM